jgi:nucleoside-diphosphate-sugar epimerase
MKIILVCGAGGFIGSNLVKKLKAQGHKVIGVDLKKPEFSETQTDHFMWLTLEKKLLGKLYQSIRIYQKSTN